MESAKYVDLSINKNKTKYMEKTKFAGEYSDSLIVYDFTFENVNSFTYVGIQDQMNQTFTPLIQLRKKYIAEF